MTIDLKTSDAISASYRRRASNPWLTIGNNEKFPRHPDGSRDLDESWSHLQTWKELEKLPASGKVRAIGVSNYSVRYLEQLLSIATITPATNQIENHPYLPQKDIVDFCKGKGILVEAYSPLGSTGSPLFQEQGVQEVAEKHKVTAGAVLLSYHSKNMPPGEDQYVWC